MRKNSIHTVAIAAAMLAGGFSVALAATPVESSTKGDLSVTGAITPGSCTISFDGSSVFDFAIVTSDRLDAASTRGTALPTSPAQALVVNCTASTQVAIGATDQRATSVAQLGSDGAGNYLSVNVPTVGDTFGPGKNANSWFGLGLTDAGGSAKSIGAYVITADTFKVDNADASALAINAAGTPGPTNFKGNSATYIAQDGGLTGWKSSQTDNFTPALGKRFSANLYVTPVIANTSTLPLNQTIKLDGNATFTVFYL